MKYAIIPKFLFEDEDIISLIDKGIKIEHGKQTVGEYKVPCYKFYNLTETEVFDELDSNALLEDVSESQKMSYANRVMSILFLKIRQVAGIQDKNQKLIASCSLIAAVNSLADLNINYAKRFLPMLRGLV